MVLYRNARRLHPYAACDSCGEYRSPAVQSDDETKGYICLCCKTMRAKPNRRTIAKCPCCVRENVPFERHHMFGHKLHRALGKEKETVKICLNCHADITAYFYPIMKLQSLMLLGRTNENITDEMRITIVELSIIVVFAYFALWYSREYCGGGEDSNIVHRFLRKLKSPEEIREFILDLTRKINRDRTGQKQIEAGAAAFGT